MILCSTIRKLAEQKATIYRTVIPAHTVTMGNAQVPMPEQVDYFATLKQAEKRREENKIFASLGVPDMTIVPELCTMEQHYMRT